jgi:hypothetical protein
MHPARFSPQIIDKLERLLDDAYPANQPHIHDPFAGTGERLVALARRLNWTCSGTELEPAFIETEHVRVGNATHQFTYPAVERYPYIIVTSPVYPNGMADSWAARDGSKHNTYREAKARLLDLDPPDVGLHPDNMGGMGYRGTKRGGTSKKRVRYWEVADQAVECWWGADAVYVNVSDFMHSNGEVEPVVEDWARLLRSHGWTKQTHHEVETPRMGHGQNRDQRVAHEIIIEGRRHG